MGSQGPARTEESLSDRSPRVKQTEILLPLPAPRPPWAVVDLFDTTSTYFEIEEHDAEGEGPRRFGNSKDHRPNLPQEVIGLAVTRQVFSVRCWVLPGNRDDASLVEQIHRDMAGWKLSRVVWVVAGGMAGGALRRAFTSRCRTQVDIWCVFCPDGKELGTEET